MLFHSTFPFCPLPSVQWLAELTLLYLWQYLQSSGCATKAVRCWDIVSETWLLQFYNISIIFVPVWSVDSTNLCELNRSEAFTKSVHCFGIWGKTPCINCIYRHDEFMILQLKHLYLRAWWGSAKSITVKQILRQNKCIVSSWCTLYNVQYSTVSTVRE